MVMHDKVSPWGKRHLSGSHFELAVEFVHVAIHNLLYFNTRRNAACFHGFLSRQAIYPAKQRHDEQ
jgi:hypothetical protein